MCNLKSPHAQVCYAVGKIKPPIAGDIGESYPSHVQDATATSKYRQRRFLALCCVTAYLCKALWRYTMFAVNVSDQCACCRE